MNNTIIAILFIAGLAIISTSIYVINSKLKGNNVENFFSIPPKDLANIPPKGEHMVTYLKGRKQFENSMANADGLMHPKGLTSGSLTCKYNANMTCNMYQNYNDYLKCYKESLEKCSTEHKNHVMSTGKLNLYPETCCQ